eukprot:jgi/Botrbrau1/9852/Bobra.0313s0021.1
MYRRGMETNEGQLGDEGPREEEGEPGEDPAPAPAPTVPRALIAKPLLKKLKKMVNEENPSLGALAGTLQKLAAGVEEEMRICGVPLRPSTVIKDLQAFTRLGVHNLGVLEKVLDLDAGSSSVTPISPDEPIDGPVLHVVGVAMVVAGLLKGGAPVINDKISETGIIPKLMGWALTSPVSNHLQLLCLRIFRHSMMSNAPLLWTPLVQRAMGLPEHVEVQTQDSLQERLVKLGREASEVPIGLRTPAARFAITLADLLRAATSRADVPPEVQEAQAALGQGDWQEYCAPGGLLDQLLSEQLTDKDPGEEVEGEPGEEMLADERPQEEEKGKPEADPAVVSKANWEMLTEMVGEEPPSLGAMGTTLKRLAACVEDEMQKCGVPLLPSTVRERLTAFTRHGVDHLDVLEQVLDLDAGSSSVTPFSPNKPVDGPGLHVVGVAMVVASLLKGGTHVIDREISQTMIIPKLMGWAVTSPTSSPLQFLCLRIFRHSTMSETPLLWTPLVQPAMGLPEEVKRRTEDSLQVRLVELGREAVGLPIGLRSPAAGFAIALAQLLHAATSRADVPPEVQEAQEALRQKDWQEYCAPGGHLDQLLSEQMGELCGPKPPRDAVPLPGGWGGPNGEEHENHS